jgi:hypothetical protein
MLNSPAEDYSKHAGIDAKGHPANLCHLMAKEVS